MIPLSVPEIEEGSPERDGGEEGEEEGLVLEYSCSWIVEPYIFSIMVVSMMKMSFLVNLPK